MEEEQAKKKVMVAIDESEYSEYALKWTLDTLGASISSSSVFIFTAQPLTDLGYLYTDTFGTAVPPDLITGVREQQNKVALALLEKANEICKLRGVTPKLMTEVGDPKVAICEAVDKLKINLLVLGSQGKGMLKRNIERQKNEILYMSLVQSRVRKSLYVLRKSNGVPCMISSPTREHLQDYQNRKHIKENISSSHRTYVFMSKEENTGKKILVAIDGSECSHYALQWTLDYLCNPISTTLVILTVQPLENLDYQYATSLDSCQPDLIRTIREHQSKVALTLLETAQEMCLLRGVTPMTITTFGRPKQVVCEVVENHKIDLLVLGSQGNESRESELLGSVSNYCVQNVRCHVLVVRKPVRN